MPVQKPQYATNQQGQRILQSRGTKQAQTPMQNPPAQAGLSSNPALNSIIQRGQKNSRTGQTGALGMLSERMAQGLNKKKKMAGQQNAMAQQGLTSQALKQPTNYLEKR